VLVIASAADAEMRALGNDALGGGRPHALHAAANEFLMPLERLHLERPLQGDVLGEIANLVVAGLIAS